MTAHNPLHQLVRENVEAENTKSHEAPVAGRPITASEDNAVQQRQELLTAMKAFRFTNDSNNSFTLVDSGKEISDKRPMNAGRSEQTEDQKEAQAAQKIKDALPMDAIQATKEALKGLTPDEVKHVLEKLKKEDPNFDAKGLELIVDKTTGKVTVKAGTISYWPLPGRSGGQEVYSETP
jgi:hypothetical protein